MDVNQIILLNEKDEVIYKGKITSLPLSEKIIIEKSIEFFNDDSPCFIHRSAVMNRIYFEIETYLSKGEKEGKHEWFYNEIPENIFMYISHIEGINKILI